MLPHYFGMKHELITLINGNQIMKYRRKSSERKKENKKERKKKKREVPQSQGQ